MCISFILQPDNTLISLKAEKEEFSIELDCIRRAEPVDTLVTGRPYCLRVTIVLVEKPSTVVNNWAFFNLNFCKYCSLLFYLFNSNVVYPVISHRVNNQELDILLKVYKKLGEGRKKLTLIQANDEEEMKGWVRDLCSTSSGLV